METEKNGYAVNNEEFGTVKIANDVVAMIAGLAATEVDGVGAMVGNITNELMGKVGMKKQTKGVKVDILDGNVSVELAVTMESKQHGSRNSRCGKGDIRRPNT